MAEKLSSLGQKTALVVHRDRKAAFVDSIREEHLGQPIATTESTKTYQSSTGRRYEMSYALLSKNYLDPIIVDGESERVAQIVQQGQVKSKS